MPIGAYSGMITSNVSLSSSAGVTSSAAINIEYAHGQFSIQADVTLAHVPKYCLYYTLSNDDLTYYQPIDGDNGIITSAMTSSMIFSFAPKIAKSMKIYALNENTGSNLTVTKLTLFFNEQH